MEGITLQEHSHVERGPGEYLVLNFSCDTSPVYTTQVLIHIDQKLRLVFSVSSVYLCQFVAFVAFRRCSIRYRTFLESRCSLTSKMVRRSEGRHARIYEHSSST